MGERAQYRRLLLQEDFDRFAKLTGDDNPIHCDPAYAVKTHFGATVAHGMCLYGCIAKALAELIPGPGCLQLEQSLMFPNPTFAGDELTVALEVTGEAADGTLDIATVVTKPSALGTLATAQGAARVRPAGPTSRRREPAPATAAAAADGDGSLYGLAPGMSATAERTFTVADLAEYGDLIGDRNPLFRDDAYARARGFRRRLVPGPLLAGMFSDLLGTRLPGRGTGWMKQRTVFLAPAYPGEALTARVEVTRLRRDKELVNLRSTITAADGRAVCDGESLVLVRNLAARPSAL
ncbi:MAG: MaoC family dehydratase [Rhodocyclales bacterium]|nr:MaoC family dehydratase [Rhodocyclales bacterium]